MKEKMFICLILAICFTSAQAQTIGFLRNAQARITTDMNPIKSRWEKLLLEQNQETVLTDFTIKSGLDKATQKTYYILIATNRAKSLKIAELLKLKGNGDFIFMPKTENRIGTITCSGCATGCNPEIVDGKWVCESECASAETTCTKTDTTTP